MTTSLLADETGAFEAAPPPVLELRGISKSFPGVRALSDVSFSAWPGEIHMLLGENGAGKSTLMKVLCGAVQADAGSFRHKGQEVAIGSPVEARALGVAVIFQEFSLVPYLDIAQNIFLGRAPAGRIPGTIDTARMYRDAKRILDSIGFEIDPRERVHRLGVAQQQMVEIAKALSQDARILVMDEPTAALSDREAELLFATMRRLKAEGVAIIYISHRMAEVFALGDRITVLRDGKLIRTLLPAGATPAELVRLMVGRTVDMTYPRRFRDPGRDDPRRQRHERGERDFRYQSHGPGGGDRWALRARRLRPHGGRARDLRRRSRHAGRGPCLWPDSNRGAGCVGCDGRRADPGEP